MSENDRRFEKDLIEDVPSTSVANVPHTQTEPVVSKDNKYKKRNKTMKTLRDKCVVKESTIKFQ